MDGTFTDFMSPLTDQFTMVGAWAESFGFVLGGVLVSLAVIWSVAIAWRKYKESCDKV